MTDGHFAILPFLGNFPILSYTIHFSKKYLTMRPYRKTGKKSKMAKSKPPPVRNLQTQPNRLLNNLTDERGSLSDRKY